MCGRTDASEAESGNICLLIAKPMMPMTTAPRMPHPTRLPMSRSPGCGDGPLPRCGGGVLGTAFVSARRLGLALAHSRCRCHDHGEQHAYQRRPGHDSTAPPHATIFWPAWPHERHLIRVLRSHGEIVFPAFSFAPERRAFALLFASVAPRTRGRPSEPMVVDESRTDRAPTWHKEHARGSGDYRAFLVLAGVAAGYALTVVRVLSRLCHGRRALRLCRRSGLAIR